MKNFGRAGVLGWVALVCLAGIPAHAYEVRDPNHLLDQLDQYLSPTYADSFKVGDLAQYNHINKDCEVGCGADGCSSICTSAQGPMTRQVTTVTADQATIELDDGTTESWTQQQFADLHGNSVRHDLPLLDFQCGGYLETSTLADRSYTLPSGQVIQGKEIVLLFYPEGGNGVNFKVRYTVSHDGPFAGQIVQMAAFGAWFYQMTGVTRAQGQ